MVTVTCSCGRDVEVPFPLDSPGLDTFKASLKDHADAFHGPGEVVLTFDGESYVVATVL